MSGRSYSTLTTAVVVFACLAPAAMGSDWSRFRGPHGAGIAIDDDFPTALANKETLRWKVDAGTGTSSPVVIGGRVFLTAFAGDERIVTCLDAASGATVWKKSVRAERNEIATPPGGPANSTPAADAANVYVFFPELGVYCFSHEGDQRWQVPLGPFHSFHGITASLTIADGKVFVLVDQLQDSFLAALDGQTGAELWKVARLDGPIGGYSTPAIRPLEDGRSELVVSGPMELVGYDTASGQRRWSVSGVTNAPISVPVCSVNQVFVCEPSFTQNPFNINALLPHDKNKDGELSLEELQQHVPLHRIAKLIDKSWGNSDDKVTAEELDKAFEGFVNGGGLVAVQLKDTPDGPTADVQWTYRRSVPQIPSLLYYENTLFFVNDGGIFTSVDPATGEFSKRARLEHGSSFYASPVAAAGKILLVDTEGKIAIVSAKAQWEVVGTHDLDQACYATPAIANGRLYIRGERELFCFGAAG